MIIDISHALMSERLHDSCNLTNGGRCHEQVHMIGHQNISVDGATFAQSNLAQFAQISKIVNLGEKAWLPIIPVLGNMLRNADKI